MTQRDLDKHYEREVKMQMWRILTPVFSVLSPLIVATLAFFMVRMINQFDERNKEAVVRIESVAKGQEELKLDLLEKYSQVRYQCCSELK